MIRAAMHKGKWKFKVMLRILKKAIILGLGISSLYYLSMNKKNHIIILAPIAQLVEGQTIDRKVAGLNFARGCVVVSLNKTLHPHCLVLVKPRKLFQHD